MYCVLYCVLCSILRTLLCTVLYCTVLKPYPEPGQQGLREVRALGVNIYSSKKTIRDDSGLPDVDWVPL